MEMFSLAKLKCIASLDDHDFIIRKFLALVQFRTPLDELINASITIWDVRLNSSLAACSRGLVSVGDRALTHRGAELIDKFRDRTPVFIKTALSPLHCEGPPIVPRPGAMATLPAPQASQSANYPYNSLQGGGGRPIRNEHFPMQSALLKTTTPRPLHPNRLKSITIFCNFLFHHSPQTHRYGD